MFFKTLFALTLGLAAAGAVAAPDYYVVVPIGQHDKTANIQIDLANAVLPQGIVGNAYSGFDLRPLLRVTGDPAFLADGVQWELFSGSLPAGLQFNANGTITGTPTAAASASFTVRASYKLKEDQVQYQLIVLNIQVRLDGADLEPAFAGESYPAVDFNDHLQVDGDPAYQRNSARFTGTDVPQGMTLSSEGLLSGTPLVKNVDGATFTVAATYRSKGAQQTYTLVVNATPLRVTHVATASQHSCAVTVSGGVKCWGRNNAGQLGNDSRVDSSVPVDVVGLQSGVSKVYTRYYSTCAITVSGAAKCWGNNADGQLGNGANGSSQTPTDVVGLSSGVTSIAISYYHSCAVVNGGAKCWGAGWAGQLGDGTTGTRLQPVDVVGHTSGVIGIVGGMDFSCLLTSGGRVKCWGAYRPILAGQAPSLTPIDIPGATEGIVRIVGIVNTICAQTNTGGVKCWGLNSQGQAGVDPAISSPVSTPTVVAGVTGVVDLDVSGTMACALLNTQQVKCWGSTHLGIGQTGHVPATVPVNDSIRQFTSGSTHACVLTASGLLKCFGDNTYGQLGIGNKTNSAAPIVIEQSPPVQPTP